MKKIINSGLPEVSPMDFVVQLRFSDLKKSETHLNCQELIDKLGGDHYDIVLTKSDGSYTSYGLVLDEDGNFNSGHLIHKSDYSHAWGETIKDDEFIVRIDDKTKRYLKMFTVDRGKFVVRTSGDVIKFIFFGSTLDGIYEAKINGNDYVLNKLDASEVVEKYAKEYDNLITWLTKHSDDVYKTMAQMVKRDISLGSYSRDDAVKSMPFLKDWLTDNESLANKTI